MTNTDTTQKQDKNKLRNLIIRECIVCHKKYKSAEGLTCSDDCEEWFYYNSENGGTQ